MGLTVLTPPAIEPVTLDEALVQCRITSDTEDGLIAGLVIDAVRFAENVTRRPLIRRTYRYSIDWGWPMEKIACRYADATFYEARTRINLPRDPVLTVSQIQYADADGNLVLLDPAQYFTQSDVPQPYIEPALGVTWPTTRVQSAAILVDFDAGYGDSAADAPAAVRRAILLLVSFWYDNRGSATAEDVPPAVYALLGGETSPRILA